MSLIPKSKDSLMTFLFFDGQAMKISYSIQYNIRTIANLLNLKLNVFHDQEKNQALSLTTATTEG
jgi:hypothetical protein